MRSNKKAKKARTIIQRILTLLVVPISTILILFLTPLQSNLLKDPSYILFTDEVPIYINIDPKLIDSSEDLKECLKKYPRLYSIEFDGKGSEQLNGQMTITVSNGKFEKFNNDSLYRLEPPTQPCTVTVCKDDKIIIDIKNFKIGNRVTMYFQVLPFNAKINFEITDTLKNQKLSKSSSIVIFLCIICFIWITQVSLQLFPPSKSEIPRIKPGVRL